MNTDPDLTPARDAAADIERALDDFEKAAMTTAQSIDLALSFQRLFDVVPIVTRHNRRTDAYEPAQEVRLTFRRKSGQWYAGVGKTGRTGTSAAEAITGLAEALEDAERDKAASGNRAADR